MRVARALSIVGYSPIQWTCRYVLRKDCELPRVYVCLDGETNLRPTKTWKHRHVLVGSPWGSCCGKSFRRTEQSHNHYKSSTGTSSAFLMHRRRFRIRQTYVQVGGKRNLYSARVSLSSREKRFADFGILRLALATVVLHESGVLQAVSPRTP